MSDQPVDCRSPEGETVGLIDAAIHILRLISRSDVSGDLAREALRDLAADPECRRLLDAAAAL